MSRFIWQPIIASCAIAVGSSCSQQQIEFQSNGFNRAIEQTSNELLLLNVVRASKDLPLYFSKISKYTGGNMASGSFQPKFPFGPRAIAAYDLGITTSWSGGVSSIEFADINQDEGLSGLREQIKLYVLDQYLQSNFPPLLLYTILLDGFEVNKSLGDEIERVTQSVCEFDPTSPWCKVIAQDKMDCRQENWNGAWSRTGYFPLLHREKPERTVKRRVEVKGKKVLKDVIEKGSPLGARGYFATIKNSARSRCSYTRFQTFLAMLIATGFQMEAEVSAETDGASEKKKSGEKIKSGNEDKEEPVKRSTKVFAGITGSI